MNSPPKVFIIYSSDTERHADRVLALSDRLRKEGIDCHLDQYESSPSQGWARWRREQIEQADYILVVCTEAYKRRVTDEERYGTEKAVAWEKALLEDFIYQTAARNSKVIPVLFSSEDEPYIPTFLGTVSSYVLYTEYRKLYRHLTNQPETLKPDLGKIIPLPPKSKALLPPNPYRGLDVFRKEHKDNFFGRSQEIAELQQLVEQHRLVVVTGTSGSGKSSLVLAGLVPVLEALGAWVISEGRPKHQPFEGLAAAFVPWLYPDPLDQLEKTKELALKLNSRNIDLPHLVLHLQYKFPQQRFLLIIDQFEEVFTLTTDLLLQQRFLDSLLKGVQAELPLTLLFTLRADFMGQVLAYGPLATTLDRQAKKLLSAMDTNGLCEAIEEPAKRLGVSLETGLTQRILDDVGKEPGNLPLLEFALTELWQKQQYGDLTHAAYEEIGGVQLALARHADKIYTECDTATQARFRQVFMRLVHPGDGTGDTHQVATRDEVRDWELVRKLADARLLVTGHDENNHQDTVTVVHETLIRHRHWRTLQQWLKEDRKFLVWLHNLHHQEQEWRDKQDEGLLLRGFKLLEAQEKLKTYPNSLSDHEKAFIAASVTLRERKKRLQQRNRWLLTSVLVLICLGVAGWLGRAIEQSQKLQKRLNEALTTQSLLVADLSRQQLQQGKTTEAILLALNSLTDPNDRPYVFEAHKALQDAIDTPHERAMLVHEGEVNYAAFSPDSLLVITASMDKTAYLWEVSSGKLLQTLAGHHGEVNHAAFSPDGQLVVTTSADKTARLWEVRNGRLLQTLAGHEDRVNDAVFSPDGQQVVTASSDKTARLWEISDGRLLQTLVGHEGEVNCATFSPDGQQIVTTSSDKTVRLWEARSGKLLQTLVGHEKTVWHAAFSPDGQRLVTTSADKTARLWEVRSGRLLQILGRHTDEVTHAVFSPDGQQIATASKDETARLWEVSSGKLLHTLMGHQGAVNHAVFSPDSQRVVTASVDKTAHLWEVNSGRMLQTLVGHEGKVYHAAFSPDDQWVVTTSQDNTARLWEVNSGKLLQTLARHEDELTHAAFSPDGQQLVTTSRDETARLWEVNSGRLLQTLAEHQDWVTHAAFSPDGQQVVTASRDKTARLWEVNSGRLLQTLMGHQGAVNYATFSRDGQQVVTAAWDTARLWEVSSGRLLHTLLGHEHFVTYADFSPDGQQVVTTSWDKTARLWEVSNGRLLQILVGHEAYVTHAAFSPDGLRVVTTSVDKTARLWEVSSGRLLHTLAGYEDEVIYAAFSPDGLWVVTMAAMDKTARLWEVNSGRLLHTLVGHQDWVTHATFSPDGQRVVTASRDKTARLWAVNSGRLLQTLAGHEGSIYHVAFSPDGQQVVTVSADNTARLWRVFPPQELIDYAKKQVPRQLTLAQRQQFFLPIDPAIVEKIEKAKTFVTKGEELATAGNLPAAIEQFKQALALDSSLSFQPVSKALLLAAQHARQLAGEGDLPKATAAFQTVQAFGFQLSVTPEVEAKRIAASARVREGKELAQYGLLEEAIAEFKQALDWDPISKEANQSYASALVRKAKQLASRGEINSALANYTQAQQLDPEVKISAKSWETLCWYGSFYQQAEKVSAACERAEALTEEALVQRGVEGWLMGEEVWKGE